MEQRVGDLVAKVRKVMPQRRRQVIKIMRGLQVQTLAAREPVGRPGKSPRKYLGRVKARYG